MTEEKGESTQESIEPSWGLAFSSGVSVLFILFVWMIYQP
jgi:hypothetical protein